MLCGDSSEYYLIYLISQVEQTAHTDKKILSSIEIFTIWALRKLLDGQLHEIVRMQKHNIHC